MLRKNVGKSIRYKFLKDLSIVLIVGTCVLSTVIAINEGRMLKHSLMTKGQSFASYIAKLSQDPLIMKDSIQLDTLVNEANKDEDIVYTVIQDAQGNLITSQYASINYQSPSLKSILSGLSKESELPDIIAAIEKEETLAEVSVPILSGTDAIGKVTVCMSQQNIRKQIVKTILFVIVLNLIGTFILGAVLFTVSRKTIFDPISELALAAERLAKGDLSTQVNVKTAGEVRILVESFNEMAVDLEKTTVSKERLQQSQETLQKIIDSMPYGILLIGRDKRIRSANHAALALAGYGSEEEIKGMICAKVFCPAEEGKCPIIDLKEDLDRSERIIVARGGRRIPILKTVVPLELNGEEVLLEAFLDISESKRAEETLKRNEDKYRALFENSRDAIAILDQGGRYVDFNQSTLDLFGYPRDEMTGLEARTLYVDPSDLRRVVKGLNRNGYVKDYETRFFKRDRTEMDCLLSVTMRRSEDGAILDHQAIVRDITEQRKARETAVQLASIVESSDDAIMSTRLDGLILTWNRGAERIYGYSADEIRGRSIATLGLEELHNETAKILEKIKEGVGIEHVETKHKTKAAKKIYVSLSLSPVRDASGKITGASAITRDITDHKFMESQIAQAQKLESIGQLAAGIAHEINTPTQYIGDNTRFLRDAYGDFNRVLGKYRGLLQAVKAREPTDEWVREVEATCEQADLDYLIEEAPKAIHETLEGVGRVAKIVGAMKEFSHPGGAEKVAADINRAIESTITVARNEWKYVADMVTDFDSSLSPVPCLLGDFNQVILNMIINAVHAIADVVGDGSNGKGRISVATRRGEKWAEIRISDTGTGIKEGIRARVFDPFFTTKEVGKGTGQGLAIARSVIVDKHGGTIDFETKMGKGTTFIIRLPTGTEEGQGQRE